MSEFRQRWLCAIALTIITAAFCGIQAAHDWAKVQQYKDPAEVAVRLQMVFNPQTSSDDFAFAKRWLSRSPMNLVTHPTLRELARTVSAESNRDWLNYADEESEQAVPLQARRNWRVWRVLIQHGYKGGSPGLSLQKVASDPANSADVWKIIRAIPDKHREAREVKQQLLHGLMEQRLSLMRDARHGVQTHGKPAEVPFIDPEIIQLTSQLLAEIPPEEERQAYFFALKFGDYIGRDFRLPNSQAHEYQGPHGLNDVYFSEPVQRAKQGRGRSPPRD